EPYMLRRRADVDYDGFSAFGTADRMRDLIDSYIEAGATKFVARPACPPAMMTEQLNALSADVLPIYHS
ncbi:MAG: hypothetical protein OXC95_10105, partial [Dehalococcoidia bacterium]|nr:hypothetical protein [Dehalococcoidia bacterium]